MTQSRPRHRSLTLHPTHTHSVLRRLPHGTASASPSSSSFRLFSTNDSKKTEEKGGGHSVPGQAPQEMDPELVRIQTMLMEHQKTAARLTVAEEARTLVYYSEGLGVLGTNSQASSPLAGYPASAMVGFAVDENGRPIFSFSSISTHKQDLIKDPRGSFTVASKVRAVLGGSVGFYCFCWVGLGSLLTLPILPPSLPPSFFPIGLQGPRRRARVLPGRDQEGAGGGRDGQGA